MRKSTHLSMVFVLVLRKLFDFVFLLFCNQVGGLHKSNFAEIIILSGCLMELDVAEMIIFSF
jgi:hypothetical protein